MQWYNRDTRLLPAQGLPLLVLDFCLQQQLDCHRLLRGTRLFLDDVLQHNPAVSPEQLHRLLDNALQLLRSDDSPFLLGQRLLPGHNGSASQALMLAPNLYGALELLTELQPLLTPLLTPKFCMDDNYGYLYWLDSCGAGKLEPALVEMYTVAIVAFSRRQQGQHLPWEVSFCHSKPPHIEQYWVHIGEQLQFDQPCNLLRIPRQQLFHNWQNSGITARLARQQAQQQLQQLPACHSLLDTTYHLIMQALSAPDQGRPLQLEGLAQSMGLSPATLKRHLKKHGTHFQQQLDLARLHRALYLFHTRRLSTDAVARELGFHDSAGLRRSFKRWTGTTPSHLLTLWAPAD